MLPWRTPIYSAVVTKNETRRPLVGNWKNILNNTEWCAMKSNGFRFEAWGWGFQIQAKLLSQSLLNSFTNPGRQQGQIMHISCMLSKFNRSAVRQYPHIFHKTNNFLMSFFKNHKNWRIISAASAFSKSNNLESLFLFMFLKNQENKTYQVAGRTSDGGLSCRAQAQRPTTKASKCYVMGK